MTSVVEVPAGGWEASRARRTLEMLEDDIQINGVCLDLRPAPKGLKGAWMARGVELQTLPDRVGFGWDHFPGGARESVALYPGDRLCVINPRIEKGDPALSDLDSPRAVAQVQITRGAVIEIHPTPLVYASPLMREVGGVLVRPTLDSLAERVDMHGAPYGPGQPPAHKGFLERYLGELIGPNDPLSEARRRLAAALHWREALSNAIADRDFDQLDHQALCTAIDEAAAFGYSLALAEAEVEDGVRDRRRKNADDTAAKARKGGETKTSTLETAILLAVEKLRRAKAKVFAALSAPRAAESLVDLLQAEGIDRSNYQVAEAIRRMRKAGTLEGRVTRTK